MSGRFMGALRERLSLFFARPRSRKEKKQKEKEARAKRREQWHESMKATADEDLSGTFGQVTEPSVEPEEELPQQDAYELAEDEFLAGFDPFAAPEKEAPAPAPEAVTPTPEPPVAKPVAPAASEKPKSTRNDFDFKF